MFLSIFMIIKTDCYHLWFLYKKELRISTAEKTYGNDHKYLFWTQKNDNIFKIIDQIKVSRVPLWISIVIFA